MEEQTIDKRLIHTLLLSSTLLAAGYAAIFALTGEATSQANQAWANPITINGPTTQPITPDPAGKTRSRNIIAWSGSSHRSGTGLTPLKDLDALAAALEPEALAGLGATAASMRADAWEEAVRAKGFTPAEALTGILPGAEWFQARLLSKRDEAEVRNDTRLGGSYGHSYQAILSAVPLARQSAKGLEAVLRSIWLSEPRVKELKSDHVSVLAAADKWLPPASSLDSAHQYALDVFFLRVTRNGVVETGPPIRSITRGIVIAAADGWNGGDRPNLYRGGGLSPKAGNGAIVYCPDDGRYYSFFHLSSIQVSTGDFIAAGTILGLGGNTGVNARKKGHGAHVHIEIHDSDGSAWPSLAIREFILKLR